MKHDLQENHYYLAKILNGTFLVLEIVSTRMDQGQIEQQNLGIGKPQGKIGK